VLLKIKKAQHPRKLCNWLTPKKSLLALRRRITAVLPYSLNTDMLSFFANGVNNFLKKFENFCVFFEKIPKIP